MVGAMFAPTDLINRPLASLLALKRAAHIWVKFNNGTFAHFMKGEGKVNTLPSPVLYAVWEMVCWLPRAACAAARRAIGTRYGEHET